MSEQPSSVYLCRGDRKNTYIAFFVFLGIAVFGMLAPLLHLASQITAQAIAFIALIVAAYIFIRYIATLYRYEIIKEETEDYLLIVRIQGKKEFTQRKLPLATLSAVYTVDASRSSKGALPKAPVVNYSSHLLADSYSLLHFAGDETLLLRINADEAFLDTIIAYLPTEEECKDNVEEKDDD